MIAERAGVLAAIAAVLVLVGELAGAVVLQDRIAGSSADDRILKLEAIEVELTTLDTQLDGDVGQVANARADVQRALHDDLIQRVSDRAGY